jgi:carbon storage regulator
MLVLPRKPNESILIGDHIVVSVVKIDANSVRLGIEAPAEVPIHRREVWEALQQRERANVRTGTGVVDKASEPHPSPSQRPLPGLRLVGGRTIPTERDGEDLHATVERLSRERDQLSEKYHRVLDDLINAKRELLGLRDALADSDKANLRMVEYYEGVVRHRDANEVVVAYEVANDIVEQTYQRDQFIDGNMPELSEQLAVLVRVADVRPKRQSETVSEGEWLDDIGEPLSREF